MLPEVTMQEIDRAVEKFVRSEVFLTSGASSSDSDEVTYAETEDVDGPESEKMEPSQGLKGLIYHIAETDAKRKAYEHRGIHCEGCGEQPIRGIRWHCLNCPDFDLCTTCEADNDHIKTHVFAKIKIPLPVLSQPTKECPLWYPGDPRKIHPPLKPNVKKRLQEEYDFDGPQIDAHYDQFICVANMPWPNDANDIKAAIDRRAFNKALTSERWPQRFRPNAVYDRMFAFYDTNNDGLIGFEEFLSGLQYLRGAKRFTPMSLALEGFDIDGDGCVDRKDFIRMFRAKHEIQKVIIEDMIQCHEADQTRSAMDTLRSSQPISSIFSMDEIPQGEERPPHGKMLRNSDMEPELGTKTILEDNEGWSEDENTPHLRRVRQQPHERLQEHLSRFEELLDSPTDDTNGGHILTDPGTNDENQEHSNDVLRPQHPNKKRNHTSQFDGNESDDDCNAALNEDVLWQIIEEGFHEMLDPLFKAKEQEDQEVTDTLEERQKWRTKIDEAAHERRKAKEKQVRFEDAENAALEDPLVATAMSSEVRGPLVRRSDKASTFVPGPFVSTDSESLTRREEEISKQPLEELLSATGYRRVDDEQQNGSCDISSPQSNNNTSDLAMDGSTLSNGISSNPRELSASPTSGSSRDPTMPQNRPNSSDSLFSHDRSKLISGSQNGQPTHVVSKEPEELPSKERLEHLIVLDQRERQIKLRGGPGRLSFEEVDELVKADPSRELRGLVISWLEWASF
jgi:hypothetical protein